MPPLVNRPLFPIEFYTSCFISFHIQPLALSNEDLHEVRYGNCRVAATSTGRVESESLLLHLATKLVDRMMQMSGFWKSCVGYMKWS